MGLLQDLRFGLRVLVKGRWFTVAAVLALALGISVNTAVFTLADGILFRGAPIKDPDRVVALTMRDQRNHELWVSYLDFRDWRQSLRGFSDIALMSQIPFNVNEDNHVPDRYMGAAVSSSLFRILGEQAMLGRVMTDADDQQGSDPIAILSYGMWQSRYGGDPSIIGRTITVNNMLTTVIGVMRPGMQFPPNTDIWLALERSPFTRGQGRGSRIFQSIARVNDGFTVSQAESELSNLVAKMAKDYPDTNRDVTPKVQLYNERIFGSQLKLVFWALIGAVGFVLLVACANVANLQLARAVERSKEVSIRMALGASRWRVVRQLLVESVLLATIGGLIGLPLSLFGVQYFDNAASDVSKPYWMSFALDTRAFGFFFAACVLTGVIFGIAPALHISKTNINDVLKEGGRSSTGSVRARRWASVLLTAEVAFTVILLTGAGLMVSSFLAMYRLDLGIDTSRLLVMQLTLNNRKYPSQETKRDFVRRLDDRLTGVGGGITSATTASHWPLDGGYDMALSIDGRPDPGNQPPIVTMVSVGRRYFETMGLSIFRGRTFQDDDSVVGHAGVIVNQRFAEMFFPGENAVGRQIHLTETSITGINLPRLTIVGVAQNLRQRVTATLDPDPIAYVHDMAIPSFGRPTALIVRASTENIGPLTQVLRDQVRALDTDIPLVNIQKMDQSIARERWTFRVFGTMFAAFALIALLLAAIGLYAVTAHSVKQRTQEIGVRVALGAPPARVIWLFLRRALIHVGIGLAIGLGGAIAVSRLLRSLLVGPTGSDAITYATIVVLTVAVSIVACVWPARRATQLDPVAALRND